MSRCARVKGDGWRREWAPRELSVGEVALCCGSSRPSRWASIEKAGIKVDGRRASSVREVGM